MVLRDLVKPDENSFVTKEYLLQVESQWEQLVAHSRNALALKLVAAATQELFDGRLSSIELCCEG